MTNTREKILLVAEELIQKIGVSAMSYQHISDAIGIKKASIHHHFPKKDSLVHELLKTSSDAYKHEYQAIIADEISAIEKLEKIANMYAFALKEGKVCLIGMLSANTNIIINDTKEKLDSVIDETEELFSLIFVQGKNDGTIDVKLSSKEAASIFLSTLIGQQIISRVNEKTSDFDVMVKALISSWRA